MVVEVYSGAKPARPHRAWLSSLALLVIVSGLAGAMTWQRTGRLLAGRTEPAGWEISFCPPRVFEPEERKSSQVSTVYPYRLSGERGASAELAVWRLNLEEDVTMIRVCDLILQQNRPSWLRTLFGPPPTRTEGRVGDRVAVEVQDMATQTVVRSVVLETGVAYALSLRVEGAAIDEGVYRLFDLMCRSVEFLAD